MNNGTWISWSIFKYYLWKRNETSKIPFGMYQKNEKLGVSEPSSIIQTTKNYYEIQMKTFTTILDLNLIGSLWELHLMTW